jgi:hypothetical protein
MQKVQPDPKYESLAYVPFSSTEDYVSHVCTPMTYEECLQNVHSHDDYGKFTGALACIFDIDHRVIGSLANLDFLSRPNLKNGAFTNYIQWVSSEKENNIEEVLSYLFDTRDHNGEEYRYSRPEYLRIKAYKQRIVDTFKDENDPENFETISKEYIVWLAFRLGWPEEDLSYSKEMIAKNLRMRFSAESELIFTQVRSNR